MYFSDLSINDKINERLGKKGFRQLTGIQEDIIPAIMKEEDSFFAAKKSEGKTLGLVIGVSQLLFRLQSEEYQKFYGSMVVFAPSRDGVSRICEEISYYTADFMPHSCYSIITSKSREMMAESIGEYPLFITTPEDYLQAVEWGLVQPSNIKKAFFYDVQKMIHGFEKEIRELSQKMNQSVFFVFSNENKDCTLSPFHKKEHNWKRYIHHPERSDYSKMDQKVIHLSKDEKPAYVIQCIEDAIKENTKAIVLVADKKYTIENLEKNLQYHDIPVVAVYKRLNDQERGSIFEKMKTREASVLIAAAESLVDFIFPYPGDIYFFEIPTDADDYVHIIHKTSKNSRIRIFADEKDIPPLGNIEKYMKYKVPIGELEESYIENISFVRIQWTEKKPDRLRERGRRDSNSSRKYPKADRENFRNKDHSPGKHRKNKRFSDQENEKRNSFNQKQKRYDDKNRNPQLRKDSHPKSRNAESKIHKTKESQRKKDIDYRVISRDLSSKSIFSRILSFFKKEKPKKISISPRTLERLEREERRDSGNRKKNKKRPSR